MKPNELMISIGCHTDITKNKPVETNTKILLMKTLVRPVAIVCEAWTLK